MEIGTVWRIAFKPEEENELIEFLKENEFEPNETGLKKFILESLHEEVEEDNPDPFVEAITQNPEAVRQGVNFVKQGIGNFLKKKIGL